MSKKPVELNKKQLSERVVAETTNFFKSLCSQIKDNFDEHGEDIVNNSGAVGSVLKLFGQQAIDRYFGRLSEEKLKSLGLRCYLEAAIEAAEQALIECETELATGRFDSAIFINRLADLENSCDSLRLYFIPAHNPAVILVKRTYQSYLVSHDIDPSEQNRFTRQFESIIAAKVKAAFADDFADHVTDVEERWFKQEEENLLFAMTKLAQIGLEKGESLGYEQSVGQWRSVLELANGRWLEAAEEKQQPVDQLLQHPPYPDVMTYLVTFVVADFGKGKTVFLRNYAAQLAQQRLTTGDGPIPVYFNLNQFGAKRYDANRNRGILDSYLREDHNIDVSSEYFKEQNFIFLVDSLDESGNLHHIGDAMASVYKMKLNAPVNSPTPQFVVTSRPIDGLLKQEIETHIRQADDEFVPQFIALYGFKQQQFDHWLESSVASHTGTRPACANDEDIATKLIEGWEKDKNFSAWHTLVHSRILSPEELTKPLFCYILYQLIINNIPIPSKGRVGVYLAFLNYITSKAKYLNPVKLSLEQECRNRKVLHAIAANWCYNRSTGRGATLDRQTIQYCLLGSHKLTDEQQAELNDVDTLRFLSHSYFGDNENQLHFQHQSFAEVLLAEYYLKVLILATLDNQLNLVNTRHLLFVGEPTVEVMQFFEELVRLLVRSAQPITTDHEGVLMARRMLLPLLSSLAVPALKSNLYCEVLNRKLYKNNKFLDTETLLNQYWPISNDVLHQMIDLVGKMFDHSTGHSSLMTQAFKATALYNNELVKLDQNISCDRADVDIWLAAAAGGLLSREVTPRQYFFDSNIRGNRLFELIQNSNQRAMPFWLEHISHGMFHHICINHISATGLDLRNLDFDQGQFDAVSFDHCNINLQFTGCRLSNVNFRHCAISGSFEKAKMHNVKLFSCQLVTTQFYPLTSVKNLCITMTSFDYFQMPGLLREKLRAQSNECIEESLERAVIIGWQYQTESTGHLIRKGNFETFSSLYHLLYAALELDIITGQDITDSFEFMSESVRDDFIEDWPSVFKPLFTNIRHDEKYLRLEVAYQKSQKPLN